MGLFHTLILADYREVRKPMKTHKDKVAEKRQASAIYEADLVQEINDLSDAEQHPLISGGPPMFAGLFKLEEHEANH